MIDNYTSSELVFSSDLGFFESTARKYKKSALEAKNNDFSTCTPTFHLLSTICFELFPKTLIGYDVCLKYKTNENISVQDLKKEILIEFRKYGHNLSSLYKRFPKLMEHLNIENIYEFKNGYVWDCRIQLKNNPHEIYIKHIEAIRYGSFATSQDIMTWCVNDEDIIQLLNSLEEYILKKRTETNLELTKFK